MIKKYAVKHSNAFGNERITILTRNGNLYITTSSGINLSKRDNYDLEKLKDIHKVANIEEFITKLNRASLFGCRHQAIQ